MCAYIVVHWIYRGGRIKINFIEVLLVINSSYKRETWQITQEEHNRQKVKEIVQFIEIES